MSNYTKEIQNLVNAALADLDQEHRSGKLANAPVANNHYLVRWVTKALKSQRFGRTVGDDLTRWQKQVAQKATMLVCYLSLNASQAFTRSFSLKVKSLK